VPDEFQQKKFQDNPGYGLRPKTEVEVKNLPSVVNKTTNIINTDIVVCPKDVKEVLKEPVKHVQEINFKKSTKEESISTAHKDERRDEEKKSCITSKEKTIASTTIIKKSDMEKLLEIIKDLPEGRFTYEAIKRIGAELDICHKKPILLHKEILTRFMHDGKKPIEGKGILMRREKTEEEKRIEKDAQEHAKLLAEKAKTQDVEGEIKLALNKLTPENYEVMFDRIWNLKSKSSKASEVLLNRIFKKAWSEPTYIELYGRLCKELICREVNIPYSKLSKSKIKESKFRDKIITECQITFNNRNKLKTDLKNTSKEDVNDEEIDFTHRKLLFGSIILL